MELQEHDGVRVLRLNDGENRFNPDFLKGFHEALDRVEADKAHALVTVGEGKFYSNGLDLQWMGTVSGEVTKAFFRDVEALFKRLLSFPIITVAALNGHTFAAGALLALCHDFRVMREDRGFFCLPEVDLNIPFTKLDSALIFARLPKSIAHEAMVTGRRYSADEALLGKIVDEKASEAEVLTKALATAKKCGGKNPSTLGEIKRVAYQHVLDAG
jgi:enoyl-CoA hydratase/carnithine racemase